MAEGWSVAELSRAVSFHFLMLFSCLTPTLFCLFYFVFCGVDAVVVAVGGEREKPV